MDSSLVPGSRLQQVFILIGTCSPLEKWAIYSSIAQVSLFIAALMGIEGTSALGRGLSGLTYLALVLLTSYQLLNGPIYKLFKGETKIVDEVIHFNDLPSQFQEASSRYPELTICRMSGSKSPASVFNKAKHLNETSFLEYIEENLVTDPSVFISNLSLGIHGQDHEQHTLNVGHFFQPFLSDCTISGVCFTADLDAMLKADGRFESTYSLALAITFNEETDPQRPPTYLLFVPPRGEKVLFTGTSTLGPGFNYINVKPGMSTLGLLNTEYHTRLLECDANDQPFSGCVEQYLNQTINKCTYSSLRRGMCSRDDFTERCSSLSGKKLMEYSRLSHKTGCKLPCKRFMHNIEVIAKEDHSKLFPPKAKFKPMSDGHSALYLKIPRLEKAAWKQEKYSYAFPDFLGDFGGIVGLFLGMSMWGFYSIVAGAIVRLQGVGKASKK